MNEQQLIKSLIKEGESDQLEFKEIVRKDEIARILCSFLNGNGGRVLVGVKDNGETVGIEDAEKYRVELEDYLVNAIVPTAPITVSVENTDDKEILLLKVWSGSKQPYLFDGAIYYRKGSQTMKASSSEISKLIHNRQDSELHWERQAALGVDLEDLDLNLIHKTIKEISSKSVNNEFSDDPIQFLTYYGLYHSGDLTNAAVVLFAKTPSRFLPQCRIRIVVMPEGKTGSSYTNSILLEDNLFKNFQKVQDFFQNNVELQSQFSKTEWLRKDIRKYPLEALDEGVLNAIIHRDYSSVSGSVLISIYPDKLEITNYGTLPPGWKTSDLKKNHLSLPRNPDIAHICFLKGWIEKLGRGTLLIVDACEQQGLKKPEWTVSGGSTTLTFFASSNKLKREIYIDDLNSRQRHILEMLSEKTQLTSGEILIELQGTVSDRMIRNDLGLLELGGWLIKKGKGRNTIYERTEQP